MESQSEKPEGQGLLKRIMGHLRREPSTLTGKAILLILANVVGILANTLTPLILVRILSKADYGLWGMFFFVLSTVYSIMGMTVNNSASYFIPRKEVPTAKVVAAIIWFNLIGGGLAFFVFWLLPEPILWIFKDEGMNQVVALIGFLLFVWNISRAMSIIPIAMGRSSHAAGFTVLTETLRSVFVLVPAFVYATFESVVISFVIWSIIRAIVGLYYYKMMKDFNLRSFTWSVFRQVISYSFPFGVGGFAITLFQNFHHFLVGHYFDSKTYAVFRAGVFQIPFINTIMESTLNVITPELARLERNGDTKEFIALVGRVWVKLASLIFPIFAFAMVISEEFVRVMFTDSYIESVPVFRINLLRLVFMVVMIDPIIRAFAELRNYQLVVNLVLIAIMFSLGPWVVSEYGVVGAVWLPLAFVPIAQMALIVAIRKRLGLSWKHSCHFVGILRVSGGCLAAWLVAMVVKERATQWTGETTFDLIVLIIISGVIFCLTYVFIVGRSCLKQTLGIGNKLQGR